MLLGDKSSGKEPEELLIVDLEWGYGLNECVKKECKIGDEEVDMVIKNHSFKEFLFEKEKGMRKCFSRAVMVKGFCFFVSFL